MFMLQKATPEMQKWSISTASTINEIDMLSIISGTAHDTITTKCFGMFGLDTAMLSSCSVIFCLQGIKGV